MKEIKNKVDIEILESHFTDESLSKDDIIKIQRDMMNKWFGSEVESLEYDYRLSVTELLNVITALEKKWGVNAHIHTKICPNSTEFIVTMICPEEKDDDIS